MDINSIVSGEKLICGCLEVLNEKINELNIKPITIRVINSFALLMDPIVSLNGDNDVKEKFNVIIKNIASDFQLENNWLNSDISESGIDFKQLETFLGEINFHTKMQMKNIVVESLNLEELLKMRVISLDSLLVKEDFDNSLAMSMIDDIITIMVHENITIDNIKNKMSDIIICEDTFKCIEKY